MAKIKLIVGDINFNDAVMSYDCKAIITKVMGIFFCDSIEQAEEIGETLIQKYCNSYVIPETYTGQIVCVCDRKTKKLIDFEI